MSALLWLHLVGASVWLGGLTTLAIAVVVGSRAVPGNLFRHFIRNLGWAFAGLSALAWLLIGTSGLAMAVRLGWPPLAVEKAELGIGILLASAAHVWTARHADSPLGLVASRALAILVFAGTLAVFWLGVQLAN